MATVTPLPFDPTGTKPTNRVVNEQQVLTSVNFRDYHYIIPKQAPFFAESLVMGFKNPDGSSRTLVEGVDYYLSHQFISASRACAKPIYGSIEFLFTDLAGVVTLSYQSIGGDWTLDEQEIAEILANSLVNPRTTSWEEVADPPYAFPVIDHEWDLVDLVGASEVVEKLDDIREAISQGGEDGLAAHVANKSNPHDVTASQVGLGNVQNYPVATTAQAQAGTNATTYMTPLLVAQAIQSLGQAGLQAHLQDLNNPHQTTKAQVGLANVPNFPMATTAQALAGTDTASFMSPQLVAAVVNVVNTALQSHVNNKLNPHDTTKDQLQLFNVANYPPSTAQQAQDGTDNASYMTPLRVAQAIALQSNTSLQSHLVDYSNPHQTTKSQVGLALVDNYATASGSDAQSDSVANKFMTPQRTHASIMYFVGNDFLNHLNATNPHDVNASQVGLGNVQNYAVASQAEAESGVLGTVYMTAERTAQAISAQVGSAYAAHAAASNPHGTSKADVGLSNVENYPVATDPEAAAGVSTTTYLTPHGAMQLLNGNLGGHLTDYDNPHQVTATQVGLGDVQNYGIASNAEATDSSNNVKYVTPATAKIAAQVVVDAHASRTDNPHGVTASQIGLGNVQNFGLATTVQAQTGTDNATYMTPALTAAAITSQGTALVNVHANRTDNPHQTTAAQVGAYSTSQVDQLLLSKLSASDTAANSSKLEGYTVTELQSFLTQSSVNGGYMSSKDVDPDNTTGQTWAKLGTVSAQTGSSVANAKPDLIWLISGGELPSADKSPSYRLTLSIRDTPANGYVNYTLTPESPEPSAGAPEFGYVYDSATTTATIYVRMGTSSNPMTIVELNHGGGGISMSFLGYTNPPSVTMMTKSPSYQALQAQVSALQTQLDTLTSDVATGLAALTDAINNM